MKVDEREIIVNKTLHTKQKIEQHQSKQLVVLPFLISKHCDLSNLSVPDNGYSMNA